MEICRQTSLIYADYCYFFSSGNIEPFCSYQNFSFQEDAHAHSGLPPFMDEVLSEEIVKKEYSRWEFSGWKFSGGNFPGGSLMCGNFPGGNFPGGNFPRTALQTSQLALTCSKSTMEAAIHCVKSPLNKLTPAGYQRISLRYYVTTIAVEKQWDVLQSSYSKKLCKIFRGIQRCILSYLNIQSNIYDGAFFAEIVNG